MTADDMDSESRLRSIVKALSYRVLGTLTTALVTWFVTDSLDAALAVGASEPVLKTLLYYAHERAWQGVPRGAVRNFLRRR